MRWPKISSDFEPAKTRRRRGLTLEAELYAEGYKVLERS